MTCDRIQVEARREEEEEKVRMVPALAVRSAPKAAFRVNSQREDKEEKGVKVNRQDRKETMKKC